MFGLDRLEELADTILHVRAAQRRIERQNFQILENQRLQMAASDKLQGSVDALTGVISSAATAMGNAAARIDVLIGEVQSGTPGVSQADADAFADKLDSLGSSLKTAADALQQHADQPDKPAPVIDVPATDPTDGSTGSTGDQSGSTGDQGSAGTTGQTDQGSGQ